MLTYKKTITIEKNRLEIRFDSDSESPRNWSVIGKFITNERNYESPDKDKYLSDIIIRTYDEAETLEEHLKLIKEQTDALYVYPITRYEHGNIVYKIGDFGGWDYSLCGFYMITKEGLEDSGLSLDTKEEELISIVQEELNDYNAWASGEVYQFTLYDENGEFQDACGGYYDIDHIMDDLPKEFQGENMYDYFNNN